MDLADLLADTADTADEPRTMDADALVDLDPIMAVRNEQRHAVYAALAGAGPVHRLRLPSGGVIWLVTGYQETRTLLTDPRVVKVGPERAAFATRLPSDIARGLHHHMLYANPPDHTRLRKLLTVAFTRRRVEWLAPEIERIAGRLLDFLDPAEVVDLLPTYAFPLPINALSLLVGIPEPARERFRLLTAALTVPESIYYERYLAAATEFLDFARTLVDNKRTAPGDDLLSELVAARDGRDGLSEDELTSMVYLLVVAGHETTANLIGNGVRALLAQPDQLALLHADPDRMESAVEELLRFDGPMHNSLPYSATEPLDVGGVTIPADGKIFFTLLAANRDGRRFAEPHRLDLTRGGPSHLTFGHGIHHCVGASLARAEARIALGALISRFPRLALAEPANEPRWMPSLTFHGLAELLVRLES